ncbi:MAG: hypothetical protein ACYC8V_09545 [Caulobacteraceae bacterium]
MADQRHYNQEGVLGWGLARGLMELLIEKGLLGKAEACDLLDRLSRAGQNEWRGDVKGLHVFFEQFKKSLEDRN